MKTSYQFFIGVDLSKFKIDVCLLDLDYPKSGKTAVFDNTETGFKSMKAWLLQSGCKVKLSVFGMEHTGIYGVGLCNWLIKNFTAFDSARKFVPAGNRCYSRVAPFPHQSGTSIKAKTRISHLANLKMKVFLNHAARSAIRCDKQLKVYYQRKRKEGKAHLTVVNAVRNKLVARAFAVIKRQSEYVEMAAYAA